jgi:hypothetical protein
MIKRLCMYLKENGKSLVLPWSNIGG